MQIGVDRYEDVWCLISPYRILISNKWRKKKQVVHLKTLKISKNHLFANGTQLAGRKKYHLDLLRFFWRSSGRDTLDTLLKMNGFCTQKSWFWKIIVLFNWVIFRIQPILLIFRGVYTLSQEYHSSSREVG